MSSRTTILNNIRHACQHIDDKPDMPDLAIEQPILSVTEQVSHFIQKAQKAHTTVITCNLQTLAKQIDSFCQTIDLKHVYCMPTLQQQLLPYTTDFVTYHQQESNLNEAGALVSARYGLIETGTVVCSSTDQPSSSLFLPKHLLVVLSSDNFVWDMQQACFALAQQDIHARMLNFITGPSCTADIEQTLLYGAHGPKTLTIFLLRS